MYNGYFVLHNTRCKIFCCPPPIIFLPFLPLPNSFVQCQSPPILKRHDNCAPASLLRFLGFGSALSYALTGSNLRCCCILFFDY